MDRFQRGINKVNILIENAKKERDSKGYRENLGYDSEGKLRDYMETLGLAYQDEYRVVNYFYSECEKI